MIGMPARCRTWQLVWGAAGAWLVVTGARLEGADTNRTSARVAAALASVTVDELFGHVDYLAADSFEGREAGSRGGRASGVYVEQYYRRYGLKPAGTNGSYYQPFGKGYRNILGLLEGSDPELAKQLVLVGAHYDHVGYGTPENSNGPIGYIHNGADDNASGTAGLLETIEAIAVHGPRPRRSILFVSWDAEEKGLLGSYHWLAQPTLPLSRLAAALNVDMIGRLRDERLEVYGTRTSAGLRELVARQNDASRLLLDFTWEMKDDSDHWPFFIRNVPSLMLHTGLHDDYHRPSDDVERVNSQGMQQVAQLMVLLTLALADEPRIEPFRAASRREGKVEQSEYERPLRPLPGRLGVTLVGQQATTRAVVVETVERGAPAQQAGLAPGDQIVAVAGSEVADVGQFQALVLAAPAQTSLAVVRAGEAEPIELQVSLRGQPVRVGISWREDSAEPQCVLVSRVVPGSPAARAGVVAGDRLYELNGERFRDSRELAERLGNAGNDPLELILERDGRWSTVAIMPTEAPAATE